MQALVAAFGFDERSVTSGKHCEEVQRLDLLVGVDGLQSYVKAFLQVFRNPGYRGRRGRPKRVLAKGFLMGPVIKPDAKRPIGGVNHKGVQGTTTPSKRYGKQLAPAKTSLPPR